MPIEVTMDNEQKVLITANPMTTSGNPATLDGPLLVEVSSGDCTVQMISDTSFEVVSGSQVGDSVIQVSADADLGEGVVTVSDAVVAHISGALATQFGLSAGTPEPK